MKTYTITLEATAEQVVKIEELLNAAVECCQGIDDAAETVNLILGVLPRIRKKVVYEEE